MSSQQEIRITIEPTLKQHEAWQILEDNETEEFVFGGGAGGGKTWIGCEWIISCCLRYPDTKYFIARKKLKTLKQTTLITFFKVCKKNNLKRDVHYRYREQQSTIEFLETGAIIDLLEVDFKPSDPEYEDLGSSEYTAGWIEEGGEIHLGAFDTLTTRVGRQMNDKYNLLGKVFITCNPKKNWLYKMYYKPWRNGTLQKGARFVQSLVDDNPRNEAKYKDKLLNIKNKAKKQRLLYGNWEYDDDPSVLMNFESISDLFTNTIEDKEKKYLTVDVARFGDDNTVFTFWRGFEVYKVVVKSKQGTDRTVENIKDFSTEESIPYSHIVIDEDGIGGGVVDQLRGVRGFVANSTPLEDIRENKYQEDKPNYRNLKSQCAYMLADEVNAHNIAVKPVVLCSEEIDYDELLTEDLEQIREASPDSDDKKLAILSKEKVKEAIGRSPDYGDCFIMRMIFLLKLKNVSHKVSVNAPAWDRYGKQVASSSKKVTVNVPILKLK